MDEMVEKVARALATKHYADRFAKAPDDPHVQMNVSGNWHLFDAGLREVAAEISEDMLKLAERTLDLVLCNCSEAGDMRQDSIKDIAAALTATKLAERERCARIAESEGVYPELNVYAGGPDWYKHGKRIRDAILSTPSASERK